MYEIWLMLNIVWETVLGIWPLLLIAGVLWLALLALAARRPAEAWRRARPWALAAAVAGAALALLLLPGGIGSSLREMGYWLDWATLLGLAGACGAAAAALAWPLGALKRS
jgi:hypothetical protein